MEIRAHRSRFAFREGVDFIADGERGLITPKWGQVAEDATGIVGEGPLLSKLNAFQPEDWEFYLTRDPRIVLQGLRWLLSGIGKETETNLRKFIVDEEEARQELERLQDKWGHVITSRWRETLS